MLVEIFEYFGKFFDIVLLSLVCKKWKTVIKEMNHKFTLQGIRNPYYYPKIISPLNINKLFQYKFNFISLDLKSFTFTNNDELIDILIRLPNLRILDLTNCTLSFSTFWQSFAENILMIKNQSNTEYLLEELRLTNSYDTSSYKHILLCYPNLTKIYAGNTKFKIDDIPVVILHFKKLEIFDCSYCDMCFSDSKTAEERYEELKVEKFEDILKEFKAKRMFYANGINEWVLMLQMLNIDLIEGSITSILNQIKGHEDLSLLINFLQLGGDVNLYNPSQSYYL